MKFNQVFIVVLSKYTDFINVFSSDFVAKLLKYSRINHYLINLVNSQQFLCRPIYSIELIKLKTLKTYINTNLTNNFIRLSKSLINVLFSLFKSLIIETFSYILIIKALIIWQ